MSAFYWRIRWHMQIEHPLLYEFILPSILVGLLLAALSKMFLDAQSLRYIVLSGAVILLVGKPLLLFCRWWTRKR